MRTIVRAIDTMSESIARIGRWCAAVLVVAVAYEVIMRHVFIRPSLWAHEIHIMLGASLYILAFAYVHRYGMHVRADVFYSHLSPRGRAIIDTLGHLFFFFPLMILLTITSITWAWVAWEVGERMPFTGWFPPAGPLRTVVAIGIFMLTLQGVAQFIRDLHLLIKGKTL